MSNIAKNRRRVPLHTQLRRGLPFHLMLLPAVILVFIFKYIPMAGLSIAFQNYSPLYGLFEQEWVGLDNFRCAGAA